MIQQIYDAWKGGFIKGNTAMHEIGKVLRIEQVQATNITLYDTETNKAMAFADSAIISFTRK